MYEYSLIIENKELARRYRLFLELYYNDREKLQHKDIEYCSECTRPIKKQNALYYTNIDGTLDYYCPACV